MNCFNISFQSDIADVAPLYEDLRMLLFSIAGRVFKPGHINLRVSSNVSVIDQNQARIDTITLAVTNAGKQFGDSKLPLDAVDYGYNFQELETQEYYYIPCWLKNKHV